MKECDFCDPSANNTIINKTIHEQVHKLQIKNNVLQEEFQKLQIENYLLQAELQVAKEQVAEMKRKGLFVLACTFTIYVVFVSASVHRTRTY